MAVDPLIFLCIPLAIAPSKGKHFFPKNCWQHVFLFFWSPSCNVQGIWGQREISRSLNIDAFMASFSPTHPSTHPHGSVISSHACVCQWVSDCDTHTPTYTFTSKPVLWDIVCQWESDCQCDVALVICRSIAHGSFGTQALELALSESDLPVHSPPLLKKHIHTCTHPP